MAVGLAGCLWGCLGGCGPTIRADFDSPEPAARNVAIVRAGAAPERADAGTVANLVRMLDSDDPATRVLAIDALERITGERLGYDAAATGESRRAAIVRWQERGQGPVAPAGRNGRD